MITDARLKSIYARIALLEDLTIRLGVCRVTSVAEKGALLDFAFETNRRRTVRVAAADRDVHQWILTAAQNLPDLTRDAADLATELTALRADMTELARENRRLRTERTPRGERVGR